MTEGRAVQWASLDFSLRFSFAVGSHRGIFLRISGQKFEINSHTAESRREIPGSKRVNRFTKTLAVKHDGIRLVKKMMRSF
jgi:hypothetical protein